MNAVFCQRAGRASAWTGSGSLITLFSLLTFGLGAGVAGAEAGHPVAIRQLPQGGIEIESMWDFSVVISVKKYESSSHAGVDVLLPGVDASGESTPRGRFVVKPDPDQATDQILDRPANQATPDWKPYDEAEDPTSNAIRVRTYPGSQFVVVDVDGVRISHMRVAGKPGPRAKAMVEAVRDTDVIVFSTNESEADLVRSVSQSKHGFPTGLVVVATDGHEDAVGNTLVVSDRKAEHSSDPQLVVLARQPVVLGDELSGLLKRKEAACEASQKVFAELSAAQMNFRPANGTHTPRWNAEHMMGRELLFFSQIYNALDSSIPVMDLNPNQMPPDYVARHADWTGQEEARQMERVSAFTRRFAYLLGDLPLDEKAPASGWTPRRLLLQMERHYNEHTANVKKKFLLEGWPKQ